MDFLQKGVSEPQHSCLLCFYAILGKEVKASSKSFLYTKVAKTQNNREEHSLKLETGVCIFMTILPSTLYLYLLPSEKRILSVGSSSKPSLIRTLQIRLEKQMMGNVLAASCVGFLALENKTTNYHKITLVHR